ncbi:hypothetical protein GCM10009680_53910 [Streptomyces yatensis]|uniref:alpha-L-fucosidase n=1 Tax=Streptomyces yatensis TaxID=155177 RepID=A0ABN2IJR2_9ACTN
MIGATVKRSVNLTFAGVLTVLSLLSMAVAGGTAAARTPAPPPGGEPRDYAFGATAGQSSTDFGGTADRAVDANTDGRYENKSVSHTAEEFQPWWQADLGTSRKLSSIVVWNRTDCCADRLSDAWVLASDRPITATNADEARKQPGVSSWHIDTLDGPSTRIALKRSARYLRVQLQGTGYLSLAEVQAFGDAVITPSRTARQWVKHNPFGMFLHYNMSTYTNEQWADPNADPAAFNPTGLDPDQWAKAMKSAGMTFGVLTAKHHDGFALWPTAYSDHDIAAAPYENGKGDIVRAYVKAMHANHLKVGLYFSIWDRHNGDSLALVKNQLRELLTRYGTIDYLWFDGWGWSVPYSTIPYQPVRDMIRKVSPRTVVANNDHLGTLQTTDVIVYEVPVQGMPPADNPRPTDGSDTLDQNRTWFHTTETGTPRPAAEIVDNLRKAKAGNALYLLNVGPGRNGRIPQDYLDRLEEIGSLR